ncbi:hypothetical protein GZH53_13605 [Flavihumibacter sp. R14]|nr:hypothetical protein [Flavihumibacter soli]
MKKYFKFCLIAITTFILCSCAATKTWKGTVQRVEKGKDGHTAYLVDQSGEKFDAVLSIPKMETNYRLLTVGEKVKLQGDTIHFDKRVRVLVRKIK